MSHQVCTLRRDHSSRPSSGNPWICPDFHIRTIPDSPDVALLDQLQSLNNTPPRIGNPLFWFSVKHMAEPVRCNGRENITHTLNPTAVTQDHNRSISFIFARHHICVAAYPPSHPRRRWPRCSH